jgi:hypothetical protein
MLEAVDRTIDRAFWMGILAGLALIAGMAAAVAFVRRVGLKKG